MKVLVSALLLFASLPLSAGTPGSFAGTVVNGPERSDTWVYVEGHHHSLRRVYVSGAKILYARDVPSSERQSPVPTKLTAGTEVRVTAEQDDAGEWRATQIEILKPRAPSENKKVAAPTTSRL